MNKILKRVTTRKQLKKYTSLSKPQCRKFHCILVSGPVGKFGWKIGKLIQLRSNKELRDKVGSG